MRLPVLRRLFLCLLLYIGVSPVYSALPGSTTTFALQSPLSTNAADAHVHHSQSIASAHDSFNTNNRSFARDNSADVNNALGLKPDSIAVQASNQCGAVQGVVRFLSQQGGTPVGLLSIFLDQSQSYNFTLVPSTTVEGSRTVDFTLTVIDPAADAHAVVVIMDRAVQRVTYSYHYTAETIAVNPAAVTFGTIAIGTEQCRQVTLTNPTATALELRAIELVNNTGEFAITSLPSLPRTVAPGQSVTISVCGKSAVAGEFTDFIRVQFSCYSRIAANLKIKAAQARVTMGDRMFEQVPLNTEQAQQVIVENISDDDLPVELYSVDWADKEHFRTEGLESDKFPIVLLKPGDTYAFTVYYKPTEENVQNSTVAQFTGNTALEKMSSTWTGKGILPVSVQERGMAQLRLSPVTPQPLVGAGTVNYSLDFPSSVVLSVYTLLGERVLIADEGIQSAGEHTLSINSAHLLPGLYLFRIDAGGRSAIQTVLVKE